MHYAYPRLADSQALLILKDVRAQVQADPRTLAELVRLEHPAASPVATGAVVAPPEQIKQLRDSVVDAVGDWLGVPVPPSDTIRFDNALGRALHDCAALLPADAANQFTWNFLSAVVFPDVVWSRFPTLHEDRFLGRPRNALRRTWFRRHILGDLMDVPSPLGEDELVGLLERSSLARNHALVRTLAMTVIEYQGPQGRSEYARDLYKRTTHVTGPLMLDLHQEPELKEYVDAVAERRPWPHHPPDRTEAAGFAPDDAYEADYGERERVAKDSGDIVRRFHDAMEQLVADVVRETGAYPAKTVAMIEELGGLEAARKIAGSEDLSDCFAAVRSIDRLDLAVESLVLHPEYSGLFSGPLLVIAAAKLANARR